ncbi:MAG: hypothetical protein JNK60_14700, partial [Acidobacteria bacterium]|nr:hypothetical protein [Acidobacteriota bacterium]
MTQGEIRYDHAALATAAAGLATRIGFRFDLTQPNALWNALSVRAKAVGAASQGVYVTGHLVEEKEWTKLSEEIAVHETSFYRHAGQFRALEGTVLPELVRARRDEKRLIVWSAACSTGEEPYSLAIAVHRLNLGAEWRVRIVATDLSTRALALAQSRLFDPFRLRNLPPGYLEHYFDKVGTRYRVRESIASLVEFAPLNLVTGAYPVSVRQADLVLCENVLIYFREEVTREVIGKLRDTLREGGYLFLGYAETLWGLSDGFTPVSLGDTYVYRRTPMAKAQNLPPPEPSPGPRPARVSASLAPSRPVAPARPAPAAPAPAPARSGPAPAGRSGPPQGLDRLLASEDLAGALKAVEEWRAREPKEPVL